MLERYIDQTTCHRFVYDFIVIFLGLIFWAFGRYMDQSICYRLIYDCDSDIFRCLNGVSSKLHVTCICWL